MERNLRLNWPDIIKEAVKRRKEQGLTQEQFATLVGVSKPTLSSFEQGKTRITLANAIKVLHALGLD
jgi:transcriptional regulator with XRE-family HTH domain